MGPHLVVVPPPRLDADLGIDPVSKPLQRQELVAKPAVERFVGAILPRLPAINERGLDLRSRIARTSALRPAWFTDADEIDYETTQKGEPFRGGVVSRKSLGKSIGTTHRQRQG